MSQVPVGQYSFSGRGSGSATGEAAPVVSLPAPCSDSCRRLASAPV